MRNILESGRSILEMIVIIVLMILLIALGLWGFQKAVLSARVNTITKDMTTAITERRYQIAQRGIRKDTSHRLTTKVGSTQMTVEDKVDDATGKGYFTVLLTEQNKAACEEMKKYNVFTPEKIIITNENGEHDCGQVNALEYFYDPSNIKSGDGSSEYASFTSKCDGVSCGECKRCNPSTGSCENDNSITKGACGKCQNGSVIQNPAVSLSECETCNLTTGAIERKAIGASCDTCGKCTSTGTCNVDAGKTTYTYNKKEGSVCISVSSGLVCPTDEPSHQCCLGTKPVCKECNLATGTWENDNTATCGECGTGTCSNGTCSGGAKQLFNGYYKVDGADCANVNGNYCPNQMEVCCSPDCNACQECISGSCQTKSEKTSYKACGTQCCEHGCNADNTGCADEPEETETCTGCDSQCQTCDTTTGQCKNKSGSCGECGDGTCSNGTCLGATTKQLFNGTYKVDGGDCTQVNGNYCPNQMEECTCTILQNYIGATNCCYGTLVTYYADTNLAVQGRKKGDNTYYYCCEGTAYANNGLCCPSNKKLIANNTKCCAPDKVYANGAECCKGTVYDNGTKCCETGLCGSNFCLPQSTSAGTQYPLEGGDYGQYIRTYIGKKFPVDVGISIRNDPYCCGSFYYDGYCIDDYMVVTINGQQEGVFTYDYDAIIPANTSWEVGVQGIGTGDIRFGCQTISFWCPKKGTSWKY